MTDIVQALKDDVRETPVRTHLTSMSMSAGLMLVGVAIGLKWGAAITARALGSPGFGGPMTTIAPVVNARIKGMLLIGMVALVVAVYLQTNE